MLPYVREAADALLSLVRSEESKFAGWYFRVDAPVWVFKRRLSALPVHRRWGDVVLKTPHLTLP